MDEEWHAIVLGGFSCIFMPYFPSWEIGRWDQILNKNAKSVFFQI